MATLPETCDFCDLEPNEDEDLTEMRLGDLPQPQPIRIEGTDSQYRREQNNEAQNRLLKTLLSEHPSFEVTCHDMVEEVRAINARAEFHTPSGKGYSSHYDDEKVGVRVMFHPEPVESEPDARLCPRCAAQFSE
jgi:hypothetical protein